MNFPEICDSADRPVFVLMQRTNLPSGVSGYVMTFSVLLSRLEVRDKVFFMLAVSFICAEDRLVTVCDMEGAFSFDFVDFLSLIVSVDSWYGTLNG